MLEFLSEHALEEFFQGTNLALLLVMIGGLLAFLGKSADQLVGEAVVLSERSGLPKIVIGATVVSLGTTSPEAAVSVLAAIKGDAGLALGNAVGSIICDTGLILGLACLIDPPALPRRIVNRQGWLQFAAGILLVVACWPRDLSNPFSTGGNLSQVMGFVFIGLLAGYMWLSVRWAKQPDGATSAEIAEEVAEIEAQTGDLSAPLWRVLVKLFLAIGMVVLSSHVLIPAIREAALRMHVPAAIVAATLVALGTSLPELVTAVTASRRGHGDLAVGNVIGADILNVLFVAGLSAAVTPAGLPADGSFFRVAFPSMLAVLIIFRLGVRASDKRLSRNWGVALVCSYVAYLGLCFTVARSG
jgi:cation:H+ antiporter